MKQLFSIPEIHCSSCVMLLEALEDDMPGITNVSVNLSKKTAEINFNEQVLSTEKVIAAIKEISGYEARVNE